ncbi:YiiD C-terminal domain-containing protein [Rhodopirellula sp. JC740]|uniref:YiiD C-terminal domain-containing protein n=1 Tax=Rhodopirellula halodulae TaxID=2894198 RepID=A0ABS8NRR4_9BACT|nr:class I SAM-dependent methyltransferase [Rhodopirellula sp. JC740]MCC9645161.1 YiiD C-terminal domain-containing protein [Rhodopirellula sp. JC740]
MLTSVGGNPAVSWQVDYEQRVNPELMTKLLHQAIPVLEAVQWKVTSVTEGGCESILPLTKASTNQHGTHQAALISLSADYTGGLALTTLLRGVPLAGIHPRCTDEESASLWLAAMDVKYRNPSTGHLIGTCNIAPSVAKTVQQRYFAGKRVLVTLPVTFTSNGELVAEAEMRYFAQPSIQLKPTKANPRISPIFKQKLKASARMIAGLRASSETKNIRVDRSHERQAAGPHGELLANRLNGVLPQLKDMVIARTRHIDETLRAVPDLKQVVILGVGLDMRPFRMNKELGQPTFFELDLPEMLEERERVISEMPSEDGVTRHVMAADFKVDRISDLLTRHPEFDPTLTTAVVYEGCSMYFTEEENRGILKDIASLLQNADSLVWCDLVRESVVEGTTPSPEIKKFTDGMEELGERFIFGCNSPVDYFASCDLPATRSTTVGEFLGLHDPVLETYQFVVGSKV